MRTLWPQLAAWIDSRQPFALATVSAVSGSAPRAPGSCMAIMPEQMRFLGSVSSGCLDIEVVDAARAALNTGGVQHLRFGPDGKPPWTDGLTCGGWIEVRVEPWWGCHPRAEVRAIESLVREWLERDEAGVILSNDAQHLALSAVGKTAGDPAAFSDAIVTHAREHLSTELPPMLSETTGGRIFIRTIRKRPRLVLIGAVDVAARLVAFAREAGFATIVIDPRKAYVATERFTAAPDQLHRAWPQTLLAQMNLEPRDAAIVVTHDPKIDDAALLALLSTPVGYIGALGSSRSHATRLERLRSDVENPGVLERIRGPAGIHLGTPDAAGIALGIFAGIVQWQAEEERERFAGAARVVAASA